MGCLLIYRHLRYGDWLLSLFISSQVRTRNASTPLPSLLVCCINRSFQKCHIEWSRGDAYLALLVGRSRTCLILMQFSNPLSAVCMPSPVSMHVWCEDGVIIATRQLLSAGIRWWNIESRNSSSTSSFCSDTSLSLGECESHRKRSILVHTWQDVVKTTVGRSICH